MNNNPIMKMLANFMNNGGTPEQAMQQLMQKNPQMQQVVNQIRTMSNGKNMRDFTMQYLKQNGANLQEVEEMARIMGLK